MDKNAFSAIADPHRRAIIDILATGPKTIGSITKQFPTISRIGISKHAYFLEECGLLKVETKGRERYYSLQAGALQDVAIWLKQYETFWENKLDALGSFLTKQSSSENGEKLE